MKITQDFKNLKVDERFIGDVPNEVAQLFGQSCVKPERAAVRQQTR